MKLCVKPALWGLKLSVVVLFGHVATAGRGFNVLPGWT